MSPTGLGLSYDDENQHLILPIYLMAYLPLPARLNRSCPAGHLEKDQAPHKRALAGLKDRRAWLLARSAGGGFSHVDRWRRIMAGSIVGAREKKWLPSTGDRDCLAIPPVSQP